MSFSFPLFGLIDSSPLHCTYRLYPRTSPPFPAFLYLPIASAGLALILFSFLQSHWRFTKQYILKFSNFPIATGGSPIVKYLCVLLPACSLKVPS